MRKIIDNKSLDEAIKNNWIGKAQANLLWCSLEPLDPPDTISHSYQKSSLWGLEKFSAYVGCMLAIIAMTVFLNESYKEWNSFGLMVVSLCYCVLGLSAAFVFFKKSIAAGNSFALFALSMFPVFTWSSLALAGVRLQESGFGHWSVLFIELITLIFALSVKRFLNLSLVSAFIVFSGGVFFTDTVSWLIHQYIGCVAGSESLWCKNSWWDWHRYGSLFYGVVAFKIAAHVDITKRGSGPGLAWWHVGSAIFLSYGFFGNIDGNDSRFLLNIIFGMLLFLIGMLVQRKSYLIAGVASVLWFSVMFILDIKQNMIWMSAILAAFGLGLILISLFWRNHEATIINKIFAFLPEKLSLGLQKMRQAAQLEKK